METLAHMNYELLKQVGSGVELVMRQLPFPEINLIVLFLLLLIGVSALLILFMISPDDFDKQAEAELLGKPTELEVEKPSRGRPDRVESVTEVKKPPRSKAKPKKQKSKPTQHVKIDEKDGVTESETPKEEKKTGIEEEQDGFQPVKGRGEKRKKKAKEPVPESIIPQESQSKPLEDDGWVTQASKKTRTKDAKHP